MTDQCDDSAKKAKIFVVTPYYKESLEVLWRCHDSVLKQSQQLDVTHIMIADGFPRPEIDTWNVAHVKLPTAHGDNGNTPRAVGALLAEAEGANFIAYLDADNWYYQKHLTSMVECQHSTGADVVCCFREFYDTTGQKLACSDQDEDRLEHVDTSCFLIGKSAFASSRFWTMPRPLSPLCDRVFMAGIRQQRYRLAFTRERTVAFTTVYAVHYAAVGQEFPPSVKHDVASGAINYFSSAQGVREIVRQLGFWPF